MTEPNEPAYGICTIDCAECPTDATLSVWTLARIYEELAHAPVVRVAMPNATLEDADKLVAAMQSALSRLRKSLKRRGKSTAASLRTGGFEGGGPDGYVTFLAANGQVPFSLREADIAPVLENATRGQIIWAVEMLSTQYPVVAEALRALALSLPAARLVTGRTASAVVEPTTEGGQDNEST